MTRRARLLCAAAAAAATLAAFAAHADGDMRVLTDEITGRGDYGLDLQLGSFGRARNAEPGARDVLLGLVELSYGVADDWEASLQLPLGWEGPHGTVGGLNLEAQYVAPHDALAGPYWGIRIEFGYAGEPGERRSWQSEWKPILGYRSGRWHAVLNAGLTAPISGEDRRVTFEPTLRVVRAIGRRRDVGFEYQVDAGPLAHPLPRWQRRELLLAVLDLRRRNVDYGFGLGRGLNASSDRLAAKLLVEFELD